MTGAEFKALRERAGLSQVECGRALGLEIQTRKRGNGYTDRQCRTIQDWESGRSPVSPLAKPAMATVIRTQKRKKRKKAS